MPSKEVFIPRVQKPRNGVNMATILGSKLVKGDVGIEIEMEGKHLPSNDVVAPWTYHIDNSLRPPPGGMTAEYVLANPIPFDKVPAALKGLWDQIKKNKGVIVESNRTSVHVHLNVQEFFLNRLTSFLALYFIVEEILSEWCGEYRVGNLFCLRAKDASAIASYIKNFIMTDGEGPIQEFLHYAAMNANALKKFGSLEVRTLRGTSDPTVILDWVEILERLYTLSEEYPDPRDICASLSSVGAIAFFENIMGPKLSVLRDGINMSDGEIADSILQGVRIAQDLCYCRDWSLYKPMKIKPDVFGRSAKKIAKKLINHPPVLPDADGAFIEALNTISGSQWPSDVPVMGTSYQPWSTVQVLEEFPDSPEPDYDDEEPYEEEPYEPDYDDVV